jgi:hypothetical protein
MQKLEGDGLAFVHAGGTVVKRELQAGQTLMVDTGCVVAYTPNVNFEIQYVGKIKTALFGGEGLFFAKLTGPGTIWLQSLPFSRLASRVFAAAPQRGGSAKRAPCWVAGGGGGCWAACWAGTMTEAGGARPQPGGLRRRSLGLWPLLWPGRRWRRRPRRARDRSSCSIRWTRRSA